MQLPDLWRERQAVLLFGSRLPALGAAAKGKTESASLDAHVCLSSSGTSGSSKIVALSRNALEANAAEVNARLSAEMGDVWLNPLPCHHVGGLAIHARATLAGSKVVYFPAWNPRDFIGQVDIVASTLTSLVPTQLHDLVSARLRCPSSLRAVIVGGGALDDRLHARALELGWPVLRSYGMTEAASQVATEVSPGSAVDGWLPLLDHLEARTDENGVLELRGPSMLTGWMIFENDGTARWEDPKRDGWFRTSDRVELRGREVRVLGRVDDLVKIRGELVDIGALETALQARVTTGRVAVHCLPHERNGGTLRVVAANAAALDEVLAVGGEIFPPYARPEQVVVGTIETTALGKTVRRPLLPR
jgi:O-succinylbenzoic acid--CoA ligase